MKKRDINFRIEEYIVNLRAVAIIVNDKKVLFQKRKQDEFWALPGGKIRVGETGEETIVRELSEEIGVNNCAVERIQSVSEYFFEFGEDKYHQYIFAYVVKVNDNDILSNIEFEGIEQNENLVFKWFDIDTINKAPIKPDFLKSHLNNLDKTNETIFVSYKD